MAPLTLPSKADSVVSTPSQCSYSSTIVHVGDKKPQPESGERQRFNTSYVRHWMISSV